MQSFSETQRFRQWWLWILFGGVFLATMFPSLSSNISHKPPSWVGFVVTLLVAIFIYVWRLDTRLDAEGIHYRVFPVFAWRTIPWHTIKSATVAKYGFVGYGIRMGFEGWVYNIAGNKGIRIVRNNNTKIIIGTQRPEEVEAFLKAQLAV